VIRVADPDDGPAIAALELEAFGSGAWSDSLVREGLGTAGGWRWRLNLEALARDLGHLRDFPAPPPGATFDGPVLWVAGANSTYVLPEDRARMDELFPATRLVRIKNAGHWVHSEQPEIFLETLRRFLAAVEG